MREERELLSLVKVFRGMDDKAGAGKDTGEVWEIWSLLGYFSV